MSGASKIGETRGNPLNFSIRSQWNSTCFWFSQRNLTPNMKTKTSFQMLMGAAALGLTLTATAPAARAMDMPATMAFKTQLNSNLDKLFIVHAYQGNLGEVKLGKLAEMRAKDPMVKMVAQTIVKEHGMANRDLLGHFKTLGVPVPKDAGIANAAIYEKMSKLSGSAFDKAYIAVQADAHEAAIVMYSHEVDAGKNATVKTYAANKLPGILGHTAMIYQAGAKVGAPGLNLRPAPVKQAAPAAAKEHEEMMKMMMNHKM